MKEDCDIFVIYELYIFMKKKKITTFSLWIVLSTGEFISTKIHLDVFKLQHFPLIGWGSPPLQPPPPQPRPCFFLVFKLSLYRLPWNKKNLFQCWWTCLLSVFSFNINAGLNTWNLKFNLHYQMSPEGIWRCSNLLNFPSF